MRLLDILKITSFDVDVIIYDTDIGFESKQFKKWYLANQDELIPYNIRLNREIIWS